MYSYIPIKEFLSKCPEQIIKDNPFVNKDEWLASLPSPNKFQSIEIVVDKPTIRRSRNNQFQKRQRVNQIKDNPCADCQKDFPRYCKHFHHEKFPKVASISRMVNGPYSLAELEIELEKCVLLCAICHSKRHFN